MNRTPEELIQAAVEIQEKLEKLAETHQDVADVLCELKAVKEEYWRY
jgi:hypothetical protein